MKTILVTIAIAAGLALASLAALKVTPSVARRLWPASAGRSYSLNYRLAWTATLDANADSTAVVDHDVRLRSGELVTLVLVLAGNNDSDCDPGDPVKHATTYAFNAVTGALIWHRSTSGPGRCTTSAPAVWGRWVFSPGLDGYIHRYEAATGIQSKKDGWPKRFTRQTYVEKASPPLRVSGDHLYLATSGFIGDAGHYEGHLVTVNLQTGHENVWNSLCSNIHRLITDQLGSSSYCPDVQSGMFGRGQAAINPLNKDVYVVTGNGYWNGITDWGDSVLKLNPSGSRLLDSFTPTNQAYLDNSDSDLGSTGPAILPPITVNGKTHHLLVQGGKGPSTSHSGSAVIWLVNRDRMGGKPGAGHLGGQLQHVRSPGGCQVFTAPAVWVDSQGNPVVIYSDDCGVTAFNIKSTTRGPRLAVRWSISAGSTTPVVAGDTVYIARNGELDAYDPATGALTWSSSSPQAGGTIRGLHWEYPCISGSWLFMTDESGKLYAYKEV